MRLDAIGHIYAENFSTCQHKGRQTSIRMKNPTTTNLYSFPSSELNVVTWLIISPLQNSSSNSDDLPRGIELNDINLTSLYRETIREWIYKHCLLHVNCTFFRSGDPFYYNKRRQKDRKTPADNCSWRVRILITAFNTDFNMAEPLPA